MHTPKKGLREKHWAERRTPQKHPGNEVCALVLHSNPRHLLKSQMHGDDPFLQSWGSSDEVHRPLGSLWKHFRGFINSLSMYIKCVYIHYSGSQASWLSLCFFKSSLWKNLKNFVEVSKLGLLGQKETVRPILTQTCSESLLSIHIQYVALPDTRLQKMSLNLQRILMTIPSMIWSQEGTSVSGYLRERPIREKMHMLWA